MKFTFVWSACFNEFSSNFNKGSTLSLYWGEVPVKGCSYPWENFLGERWSVYQWKKAGRVLFPPFEHIQLLFWKTGAFVHESFVFFLSLQAPKWTRWRDVLLRCRLPFAAELKAQRFHKSDSLLWTGAIFTSEYCGYLHCTFYLYTLYYFVVVFCFFVCLVFLYSVSPIPTFMYSTVISLLLLVPFSCF